jgi:TonB family protein
MAVRFCTFLIITAGLALTALGQSPASTPLPQPTLLSAPQPIYPKESKRAGIGGRVSVRVVVDETGAIVSIDSPSGPSGPCGFSEADPRVAALQESVIEAMKGAKFDPALKDGKPVKSVAYLSSTFDPADQGPDPLPAGEKKIVRVDNITNKAVSMPRPEFPSPAMAARVSGTVSVQILVDENGNVITSHPVSGPPLLRNAAAGAACKAKFNPTILEGERVRIVGIVTYNFLPR